MKDFRAGHAAFVVTWLLLLGAGACATLDTVGGIHARLGWSDAGLFVRDVPEGAPSHEAGLLAGDEIVAIDGRPVAGLSDKEVVERLRGPVGSLVSLDVKRAGSAALLSVTVRRAPYESDPRD